ncbi:hypothetical protein HYALB_00008950 [Hymenoscyphus albidus]|uniref:Uncharacterized protein n=1 Tax=Hymenoscyphus albidus TaxID=595503 RepID=A0A9N9LGQ5_9HELO|nr:hypothetical protein HYALB_00008950 [Hymenoscyphus albidus]
MKIRWQSHDVFQHRLGRCLFPEIRSQRNSYSFQSLSSLTSIIMLLTTCSHIIMCFLAGSVIAAPVTPRTSPSFKVELRDPIVSIHRRTSPSLEAELSDPIVSIHRREAPDVDVELLDPVVSIRR